MAMLCSCVGQQACPKPTVHEAPKSTPGQTGVPPADAQPVTQQMEGSASSAASTDATAVKSGAQLPSAAAPRKETEDAAQAKKVNWSSEQCLCGVSVSPISRVS